MDGSYMPADDNVDVNDTGINVFTQKQIYFRGGEV